MVLADPIKVLLVHEIRLTCSIILSPLEDEAQIQIVGCATRVEEALALVQAFHVAMVLVSAICADRHGKAYLSPQIAAAMMERLSEQKTACRQGLFPSTSRPGMRALRSIYLSASFRIATTII